MSAAILAGNIPSMPPAVLSAFVCDGKISFIVEVWLLLWMLWL